MTLNIIHEDEVSQISVTRNTPTNPGTVGDELNRNMTYRDTDGNIHKRTYSIYLVAQVLDREGEFVRSADNSDLVNLPTYSEVTKPEGSTHQEFLEVWFEGTIYETAISDINLARENGVSEIPWDGLPMEPATVKSKLKEMREIIESDKWYENN